jgi:2-methylcitrate dehydratase
VEIFFGDGSRIEDEIAVADAHPLGRRPFRREDYARKFCDLTNGILGADERDRFLGAAQKAGELRPGALGELNLAALPGSLEEGRPGIF